MACHFTRVQLANVFIWVFVDHRHCLLGSARAGFWRTNRTHGEHALQAKPQKRLCIFDRCSQPLRVGRCKIARVFAIRKLRNTHLHLVAAFPLVETLGCTLPCFVCIKSKNDFVGESLQQSNVLFGKCGAASCNRACDARAMKPDDIGIALANDHFIGFNNVGFGPIKPV